MKAVEFFVDIDGDDANPGTLAQPLATLEGARDTIRRQREFYKSIDQQFAIHVRGGVYTQLHSFVLDERDSGSAEAPLLIQPYDGEQVSLIGGVALDPGRFRPVEDPEVRRRIPEAARNHVVQCDIHELDIGSFGGIAPSGNGGPALPLSDVAPPELFIDGQAMTLARWPSEGYVRVTEVIDAGTRPRYYEADISPDDPFHPGPGPRDKPYRGMTFRTDIPVERLAQWAGANDVWLTGYWYWDWAENTVRVASVAPVDGQIRTEHPSYWGVRAEQRFYAFNLLEELDTPGEWYLDREAGKLYAYLRAPLTAESAVVLSLTTEPLVRLERASYVTIRGLTLEAARGDGIQIIGGAHNRVERCDIRNVGRKAVVVGRPAVSAYDGPDTFFGWTEGGEDNGVTDCRITGTGAGGIMLNGGERRTLFPGGNFAIRNEIFRFSRRRSTYSEAISLYGVGHRAAYNRIHDAPHAAIEFRGNDHTIECNEIYDILTGTDDAGAIYTGRDWTYRGNRIRGNFLHDLRGIGGESGVFGVYLDDASSSANVSGNVFWRVRKAANIGGGRDNAFVGNAIIDCEASVKLDDRAYRPPEWFLGMAEPETGVLYTRLREVPYRDEIWRSRYPELARVAEEDPRLPAGNRIEANLLVRSGPLLIAPIAEQHGVVRDNPVYTQWPETEADRYVDFMLLNVPDAELLLRWLKHVRDRESPEKQAE